MGIKVLWDEVYRITPPEPDTPQPPTEIEGLPEIPIPPPPPPTPTPVYLTPQLSPGLVGPQPAEQHYYAQPAPTEDEFPSGNPAPGAQIKQSNDTQVNITASQTLEFEVQDENPLDRCIGMVSEWRVKVARDGIIGAVGAPTASTIVRM